MDSLQHLAVKPGLEPMEAKLVEALPADPGWRFEPKWDGFRCLIFRSGEAEMLQSKSGKPLIGYFPRWPRLCRDWRRGSWCSTPR